jgi:hypothetical protein
VSEPSQETLQLPRQRLVKPPATCSNSAWDTDGARGTFVLHETNAVASRQRLGVHFCDRRVGVAQSELPEVCVFHGALDDLLDDLFGFVD